MRPKNAKKWEKCKQVNSKDPYSKAIADFAEKWADAMEAKLGAPGVSIATIWKTAEKETLAQLPPREGLTGFMYSAAVSMLVNHWMHGDELREAYESKYGTRNA